MATYSNLSNYANTGLNRKYLDLYNPRLTKDTITTNTRTITIGNRYHRRPDLLAYDMYGNSRYWWVFVHYNRDIIKDPLNDFISGTQIVVPTKQSVLGVS